jgi:DNA-binding beta-propeller fold protein YncE
MDKTGRVYAMKRIAPLVAAIALAGELSSCGSAPPILPERTAASAPLVWPRPPAEPRIRFLREVTTPAEWGFVRTGVQGFFDTLTGHKSFRSRRPTGVAERGRILFVADPGAQALVILDPSRDRELVVDRAGPEALASPVAVAVGPGGTVFLADSALKKVFVFDQRGNLLRTIGGEGRLARPAGLAYDAAADRLYVADSQAHRILVYAADGRFIGTVGANGAAPGEFNFPTHLAVTPGGELLVTDTLNFRIQLLDREGVPLARFGRAGDGSGDFASPKGVGMDSHGHIYVVDALFDAVQVFQRDGSLLMGFGERGQRPGRFWLPNGLFITPDDIIYVADAYNQRISVFERVKP